ncbi:MAG TPA: NUDIX hydrolase [Acidimicrobiales bacterium]
MAQRNDHGEVRAAGGVVARVAGDGRVEVLVVHRPKYDDWSLPKGKAERDESDEDCARREVEEETGLRCELEDELATVRYVDRLGRPKAARYWRMRVVGGEFRATDEVDRVSWLPVDEAAALLSYPRDVEVVRMLRL